MDTRSGCKTVLIIVAAVVLIGGLVLGGKAGANNPLVIGLAIGLSFAVVILAALFAGSMWSAWLMRTGANLANAAGEHRATSEQAVATLGSALVKALSKDQPAQLPPPSEWQTGFPPAIEAPYDVVEHDDVVA